MQANYIAQYFIAEYLYNTTKNTKIMNSTFKPFIQLLLLFDYKKCEEFNNYFKNWRQFELNILGHRYQTGEQRWHSGDSTRIPPKWPGYPDDSGLVAIYGLSLLLVFYTAPRGFSLDSQVFPSPQKPISPNPNSIGCRVYLKKTSE